MISPERFRLGLVEAWLLFHITKAAGECRQVTILKELNCSKKLDQRSQG